MIPVPASLAAACAILSPGRETCPERWDQEDVVLLANEELVSPALYRSLQRQARLEVLPDDLADYLAMLYELNETRNQALKKQAIEAVRTLNAAGIEPMLMKGGVGLFAAPHCADTARMMADLDLLVPAELAEEAVVALDHIGYQVIKRYPSELHSHADLGRPGQDPGGIDLHKEVVRHTYLLPASEMWRHAEPLGDRIDGKCEDQLRLFAPSPSCRVLHNLLHSQAHDRGFYHGVLRLRDLLDLTAILRCHWQAIDWAWIEDRLDRQRLGVVLDAQLLMAGHLFGLEWPFKRPARAGALWHRERCLAQLYSGLLAQVGLYWGNLRLAFAWHRLSRRYGSSGNLFTWQLHHAVDVLSRLSPGRLLGEMRRRN